MNAPVDFKAIEGMFRRHYKQIEVRFDPERATAWTYLKPSGAPCFNLGMLEELRAHDSAIESCGGRVLYEGDLHQIHYYVGGSRIEGIFSLGGNLANLVLLIKSRDHDTLMHYAKLCVDNMYQRICSYGSPMTTISLVQGEALGGGFETALSSNVIIAERRSRMGLPEILFNAALRLEEKDLKLMSRLARSQAKLVPGGAAARPDAVEIREEMQYAAA